MSFAERVAKVFGLPIFESKLVPRGQAVLCTAANGAVCLISYKPTPLYTRHMLGVIEADRDRRRRRRHQLASSHPVGQVRVPLHPERRC